MLIHKQDGLTYVLSIGSASIASFAMQMAGVAVSALLGAIIAWLFNAFVKPKLDKLVKKKSKKEA